MSKFSFETQGLVQATYTRPKNFCCWNTSKKKLVARLQHVIPLGKHLGRIQATFLANKIHHGIHCLVVVYTITLHIHQQGKFLTHGFPELDVRLAGSLGAFHKPKRRAFLPGMAALLDRRLFVACSRTFCRPSELPLAFDPSFQLGWTQMGPH